MIGTDASESVRCDQLLIRRSLRSTLWFTRRIRCRATFSGNLSFNKMRVLRRVPLGTQTPGPARLDLNEPATTCGTQDYDL